MSLTFYVLEHGASAVQSGRNLVQLVPSNWDDYSFKSTFEVIFYNSNGLRREVGTVKIGYINQRTGWTLEKIPRQFSSLDAGWFSLGQDVDYYSVLREHLSQAERQTLLKGLADVVFNENILNVAHNEEVFQRSLMRTVSQSVILGQFRRVLAGQATLTEFHFAYYEAGDNRHAAVSLDFHVTPDSKPSTSLHVLIGRNGVGKTTLLNNMVRAIVPQTAPTLIRGNFYIPDSNKIKWVTLPKEYFSSVVSVSFSAFDPFVPPVDQPDRSQGIAYFYVGMKKTRASVQLESQPPKTEIDLGNDFIEALRSCLSQPAKRDRWHTAITRLESDSNFADMDLSRLLQVDTASALQLAASLVKSMSSGHSIVLLTITKLIDTVEEKTLVLMDEPESHLHPPLLSAFIRALSDLLNNRNGVAIIATHSPVVAQEVPRSCVWKMSRLRVQGRVDRPERETFGENVGVLTREIFGLEVSKSGFHEVLQKAVLEGGTFESISQQYNGQLGFEAQALLRVLLTARDTSTRQST